MDGDTDSLLATNAADAISKNDILAAMSEDERNKHLSMCLKLAAENKINSKNAFGLHLIRILQQKVRNQASDLQFASLSLQASSKIYAGRVEALYRDTFAFHNHLQTIISNKKVSEDNNQEINDADDDSNEGRKEKKKSSKSKQTYVTNEENVLFKKEANYTNPFPHANFITIKSAFNASRTAPRLLEGLVLQNDSCKICFTESVPYFNPQIPVQINEFSYPEKKRGLIRKTQNVRIYSADPDSTVSDVFFPPPRESSVVAPDFDLPSDDSFCIGTTPVREEKDEEVQEIITKFSILDITADLLVNDLSKALVNGNTVDSRLLPPNSALKKVFSSLEKTKPKKTPAKPQKEKPPRKPFFGQRDVDASVLKKGRRINLTDKDISTWKLSAVTELYNTGHDKFSAELANHYLDDNEKDIISRTMYKLIHENVMKTRLEGCFLKEKQLWNHFHHRPDSSLIRPSSLGAILRLGNNSTEVSSNVENSNSMVQSFQNLSLHNSPAGSDDFCLPAEDDNDNVNAFSPEVSMPNRMSRMSGFFEDDLKSVMVTPPELVKPLSVKFQTEPITLNAEKVKIALWNVIEKNDVVLLSDLHKNLKLVFEGQNLPLQYAFAMLLLLANEKCLLLETVSQGADIKITKDILEM